MQALHLKVDDIFLGKAMSFYNNLNLEPLTKADAGPPVPTDAPYVAMIPDSNGKFKAGTYYITYSFYPGKMGPIAKLVADSSFSSIQLSKLQTRKGFTRVFYISTDRLHFSPFDALTVSVNSSEDLWEKFQSKFKIYTDDNEAIEYTGSLYVYLSLTHF